MSTPLTYRQALGAFSRDARLYLASASLMGFTIFGGVYSLLLNLYLLRLGYGPEFIGLVNAAALLGWALACLPAGWLGRRWGSRRSMVSGMGVAMAGYLLLPFCELVPAGPWREAWLVATYLIGNVAISLYDVNSQPFLAEASTPAERDHLFSVQAALWPLAGFVGSLVGGMLPSLCAGMLRTSTDSPGPYRYPLIISALTLSFGAWALSRTHEHRPSGAASSTGGLPAPPPPRARQAIPPLLIPFLGCLMFLQGSGEGAARTFFNVYLDAALKTPTTRIGLLVAIGQLVAAPAALLMPVAAKRWGHRRVFLWGTLGIAVGMVPLALIPRWTAAGFGYMAVIALVSLTRPAVMVYLMEIMPQELRTTMSGVYTMAMGLSWSAVALGGSRLITSLGYPAFFLAAAACTVASAAAFALAGRKNGLGVRGYDGASA